jgi:hypothetical protein
MPKYFLPNNSTNKGLNFTSPSYESDTIYSDKPIINNKKTYDTGLLTVKPKVDYSQYSPLQPKTNIPTSLPTNNDLFNQRAGWSDKLINKALGLFLPGKTMDKIRNDVVETSIKPQIAAEEAAKNKNIKDFSKLEQKSPFVHNLLEQGRSALTAGAYIPDTHNVSTNKKVLDFASNLIGQGLGMASGGQSSVNNLLRPIGNGVEQLAAKGLKSAPNIVKNFGTAAARNGAEFAALNGVSSTLQGKNLKDTGLSMLEGLGQGAVFGAGTKAIGNVTKSAFPGWKTTFESTKPIEAPKPVKEIALTKITEPLKGKFTVKNTALEKAQQEYTDAIETIHNHFMTNKLTPDEVARIKPELGIDLDKLIKNVETAKTDVRNIADRQRMATVAGVKDIPSFKLQNPLIERTFNAPKLEASNTIKPLTAKPIEANTEVKTTPKKSIVESDILTNSDNWKDKSMPFFNRETIERNLEDITGKDAPRLKETFVEPIKVNEANAIRQKNELRKTVDDFGIAAGSQDSNLAQKYGEKLITLDELKASTKNWEKVKGLADTMRKSYDELITTANESLKRNGLKPISVRENYMPHQGELDGILKALGIEPTDLPTSINGLTPDFKPSKNFFANAMRRKGDLTVYDAVRGFDNYIEGITKIIHHTDDIGRLRGFEKAIRDKYGEGSHLNNFVSYIQNYTNQIAGKQSRLDRGAEETVGRSVYKAADTIRKQVASNAVGANISSAITNFIPLTQSLATTDKESFIKGMIDTITNVMRKDDFVNKSDFLTRRFGSDRLGTKLFADTGSTGEKVKQFGAVAWNKTSEGANVLFKMFDNFVGQTIVRGKYLEGIKKGLSEEAALKAADNWAGRIMADRSLGMTPTLLNNKVVSLLMPFQTEVNNQMSFLFKDLPKTYKGNKAQLASSAAQIALYSYLFNNLFERATGRRPAFDVLGVAEQTYNDYTGKNVPLTNYLGKERIRRDEPLEKGKATGNLINNVGNQLPFASTLLGGGRIPITNGLPSFVKIATGEAKASDELKKPLYYALPPTGGGQIKKTIEGLKTVNNQGSYNKSGTQLQFPVKNNTKNKIQAGIFGKSALGESKEFYANNRAPLGTAQTSLLKSATGQKLPTIKELEQIRDDKLKGKSLEQLYYKTLDDRAINKFKDEVYNYKKTLEENNNLDKFTDVSTDSVIKSIINGDYSKDEKIKRLQDVLNRLKSISK